MKHITRILTIALFTFLLFSGTGFAQDANGSYFTMTKFKISIPEGGSQAELQEMLNEWQEKIVAGNEHIISERIMRHQSGADSRDLVILTEYKDWNSIDMAGKKQNEIVDAAWATEDERKEFFSKFNKYFGNHADEIYVEVKGTRK